MAFVNEIEQFYSHMNCNYNWINDHFRAADLQDSAGRNNITQRRSGFAINYAGTNHNRITRGYQNKN